MKILDQTTIGQAFAMLNDLMEEEDILSCRLVVCGGAALIAASLVPRTTRDVDVVALMDDQNQLVSPDPLPENLLLFAREVAEELDIEGNWLNNCPSRNPGGLFQMGLPEGLAGRLIKKEYGSKLTVYLLSRVDQIFFKVYAAPDSGPGRHSSDLQALCPTEDELERASRWAMTHDVSEGYRMVLKSMLKQLGYSSVAERI